MNHMQFYPRPLGHRTGPRCTRNEGTHRQTLLYELPRSKRNTGDQAKPLLWRGGVFCGWRGASNSVITHRMPRPSPPLPPHIRISLSTDPPPPIPSTPLHHHHPCPSSPHLFFSLSLLHYFASKPNEEIARLVADRPRV